MSNKTKESVVSAEQLRERWAAFENKWRARVGHDWPEVCADFRTSRISSSVLMGTDVNRFYFDVVFMYIDSPSGAECVVTFKLNILEQQVTIAVYPNITVSDEDKAPLVVYYNNKTRRRNIALRPYEMDEPRVTKNDLYFVKQLLDEMTTDLGLVLEVPFDFTPVHMYIEKQAEVFEQTQFLWAGLYDYRCAIDAAWDNGFLEK